MNAVAVIIWPLRPDYDGTYRGIWSGKSYQLSRKLVHGARDDKPCYSTDAENSSIIKQVNFTPGLPEGTTPRTWDWPKLLQEFQRVTRPDGVIRVTKGDAVTSDSPALNRITQLFVQAFYQSGHLFTPEGNGVINQLTRLLEQHEVQQVRTRVYALEYRPDTPEGQAFMEDARHFVRTILPFLRKWTQVPDDYEELCQQALNEMQQPDFVAMLNQLTAWGLKG